MTKEERYLLFLYKEAVKFGDPQTTLNRNYIGRLMSEKPKGIKTICQILTQSNFIRKEGNEEICLTKNGIELVKQLLGKS